MTEQAIAGENKLLSEVSPQSIPLLGEMPLTDEHDVLTLKEAAEYLRVSVSQFFRLLKERQIPGRKVGGHWRFSRRQLLAYVEKQERESGNNKPPDAGG